MPEKFIVCPKNDGFARLMGDCTPTTQILWLVRLWLWCLSWNCIPPQSVHNLFIVFLLLYFCARQHICYSAYMLSPVRLSVCLSITRVIQSKTVEVRIMQLSPHSSPMTLVSSWLISPRNSKGNIGSGDAK